MSTSTAHNPGLSTDTNHFPRSAPSDPAAPHVERATVVVDAASDRGALTRIWESIGYDEINWTYTPTGRKLLNTFGEFSPRPFLIRPHYVFCSGTGFGIPHWGNGNVYHEDADGNPFYDFTIADQTYDAIVEAGHHVLMEIAFTPRDLLPPEADDLKVVSSPTVYSNYEAGAWAYPPKDYEKWRGLVAAHVQHCVERYGLAEVREWLFELWNEPDIFYWKGTPEQFCDLYRVTAEAVRSVLPDARVGGPAVTGGGVEFLRTFLQHTADHDVALDFVSFHTKGSAFTPWRTYGPTGAPAPEKQNPSAHKMLFEIRRMQRVIAEFPQYHSLPAIVDECDAGVPAHYSVYDNANFAFQNTEYYPVFQVKLFKKILDLNETEPVTVEQATSWSFYFEGERFFEGTRAFLTAGGIEKPLLNAYRMLSRLGGRRLSATSDAMSPAEDLDAGDGRSMREEVDVLASADPAGRVSLLVWRHTDDQYQQDEAAAPVTVRVENLPDGTYAVHHHRIDAAHSNAHTVWTALGSPQNPTEDQIAAIKDRQGLEEFAPVQDVTVSGGTFTSTVELPLPSVSLLVLEPR
ncbi:GH39 family glycosyl hydrolase [Kineococcus rhizosphaerae]|uniref:Xylan 1,4-beta-xylosidase n=1 Tax=Kineococcus rhizosphaerae TaxID=559628 RepID=A0A2T0QXW9_9ACTN|nr:glycoside hydrolase [Kineococcus rhizosphaerae]PRY10867.1 xylan 1,4-beta-xylosidase [Kineococcus rhizosphaerae]